MICLKRIAAISFLLVLLFQAAGYRIFIAGMQQQSEATIEQKADSNDYTDADLVSVKTRLNLPYYNSSAEFERAYGSININGVDYEYVKRRVHSDTLELLCLPNYAKTQLKQTANELAKAAGDASTFPQKKNNSVKLSLPELFLQAQEEVTDQSIAQATQQPLFSSRFFAAGYAARQERPPQVSA